MERTQSNGKIDLWGEEKKPTAKQMTEVKKDDHNLFSQFLSAIERYENKNLIKVAPSMISMESDAKLLIQRLSHRIKDMREVNCTEDYIMS